jgi:polyketide biosynthesis enoyl-CoA hydratase PksI
VADIDAGVVRLTESDDGVVEITMRDTENRNTFSYALIEGLMQCFDVVARNDRYKVVVLTGYDTYFASGGTKELLLKMYKGEITFNDMEFFRLPLDCPLPVISAMQGHGLGGGFIFGLYADLVVLSRESIYTANFMKYGFTPGMGATLIAPVKLGDVLANEMLFTARTYRGEELAARGLPIPVVPRHDVLAHARQLARTVAEKPRLSLLTLKEHMTFAVREQLPLVIERELRMHEVTFHQPEVETRIEAFFAT